MNRLVLSLVGILACIAACQGHPNTEFPFGRIVNGNGTTIEEHPYQVSIQTVGGSHFCGGSLVNSNTVVTAAHCLQKHPASKLAVRLGSTEHNTGGELVTVRAFKFHEGYNSKTMVNDIAVIKLATPVRQTAKIRTIPLASVSPKSGTPAVVTGWGTTCFMFCASPKSLMKVGVDLVAQPECASDTYKYGSQIEPTMLCGYDVKKDACQGDSGGPLVANGELVGVVSWGSGCGRVGYPGVYGDVFSMRNWLDTTIETL